MFGHHNQLAPELSQVVVVSLSISGAHDTERKAGLQMPDLQQNHCQVMDEQQSIHQWYSKLHYALVVLLLSSPESKALNQGGQNDLYWIEWIYPILSIFSV